MKANKQRTTTFAVAVGLLFFIGWSFLNYLNKNGRRQENSYRTPQKAVMQQAEAANAARLEELVLQGKLAVGMTMAQVRQALGDPVRTLVDSSGTAAVTVWWYEHESGRTVRFDASNKVIAFDE